MKDKLGKKNHEKIFQIKRKTYIYLIDDSKKEDKEAKGTKKCVIKGKF